MIIEQLKISAPTLSAEGRGSCRAVVILPARDPVEAYVIDASRARRVEMTVFLTYIVESVLQTAPECKTLVLSPRGAFSLKQARAAMERSGLIEPKEAAPASPARRTRLFLDADMPFGKYSRARRGQALTVREVIQRDRSYVEYLLREMPDLLDEHALAYLKTQNGGDDE